jgi:hypothetical protein
MEGYPLKKAKCIGRYSIQMVNRITVREEMVWIELDLDRVEWRTYCVTLMDSNIITNSLTLNNILRFF